MIGYVVHLKAVKLLILRQLFALTSLDMKIVALEGLLSLKNLYLYYMPLNCSKII